MRRRIHRSDANRGPIVEALVRAGCGVYDMGRPVDLLVYAPRKRETMLLEIKNRDGKNQLTKAQKAFRASWPGPWYLVHTPEEALQCVGAVSIRDRGGEA